MPLRQIRNRHDHDSGATQVYSFEDESWQTLLTLFFFNEMLAA
jgi:hypothetical protein